MISLSSAVARLLLSAYLNDGNKEAYGVRSWDFFVEFT